MRHVTDDERRSRIAVRHALAPAFRVESAEAVVRAMTVLHATQPASVYLSYWARSQSPEAAQMDNALYTERSLIKQLAMRRTLFVFPRDLLSAAWGSASARVAVTERNRIAKLIVNSGVAADGEKWLERLRAQVICLLAEHPQGFSALELRRLVPEMTVKLNMVASAPGLLSQVLTYLGARGDIVRATNRGHWRTAQPRWTAMRHWLGGVPEPCEAVDGYREIVRRWLRTFGPGTEDDLVWWLGATRAVVRAALAELGAVEVSLDRGARGWLLPDDLDEVADPGSWVALLPSLDPTVMGWRSRDFYIGSRNLLFDRQGNAGSTVWIDGRVVGYWVQNNAGTVKLSLFERVATRIRRALEAEAVRLTAWLGGVQVPDIPRSRPQMPELLLQTVVERTRLG